MKILVAGGAGYIGSIMVEQLIKEGEEVVRRLGAQHGVTARPAVAERGIGATRRRRGGRKGALFFLSPRMR